MADMTAWSAKIRVDHHDRSNSNCVRLELNDGSRCDRLTLFELSDEQFKTLVELFSDEDTHDFSRVQLGDAA